MVGVGVIVAEVVMIESVVVIIESVVTAVGLLGFLPLLAGTLYSHLSAIPFILQRSQGFPPLQDLCLNLHGTHATSIIWRERVDGCSPERSESLAFFLLFFLLILLIDFIGFDFGFDFVEVDVDVNVDIESDDENDNSEGDNAENDGV